MDLELTAFVAGSLFDGTTIQPPLVDGACETSLVARSYERRFYSPASVTQTSVTQTSNSTVVLFTLFTFTIEGCLDSKLISCTVMSCKKSL